MSRLQRLLKEWRRPARSEAKEPLEILTILKDGENYAKRGPKHVRVTRAQKELFFDITGQKDKDKKDMLAAKQKVASYLMKKYKHRKFLHVKQRGKRVWWWMYGGSPEGLRAGIQVKPTDEEMNSILRGPAKGVNT